MNASNAFYQQQVDDFAANKIEHEAIWLQSIKAKAKADFLRLGLPTPRHEDWKYTRLDTFLQQAYTVNKIKPSAKTCPDNLAAWCLNGEVIVADKQDLPKGVIVCSLVEALSEHAAVIKPYLNQILAHQHGFQALNTAMLQAGVVIYLPKGAHLDEPLRIVHQQTKSNQAVYTRHLIIAEEGSFATIIEDYQGDVACSYLTNSVTEAFLARSAHITHYKLQCESPLAYHVGHLAVKQNQASQLDSHVFSLGARLARSDIHIRLLEPNARCLMNGVYLPGDGQHLDQHTFVSHEVPDCESQQDYKGILLGRSRAVFNGIIYVNEGAQHTRAQQQNKNLLLSKHAEIDTKPQLEIFADDVICTHGATVGQLDEDALFYMATRGIERSVAIDYLIQAFAADNLQYVTDSSLAAEIKDLFNKQLSDIA